MKSRICNNKKGIAIDYAIPIIILLIVGALFIVLFNFNLRSKSDKMENDVQQQKDIVAGHDVLVSYLMRVDEQGNNKADLILKSYLEKNYDGVKNDMDKYFRTKLINTNFWRIEALDSLQKNLFSIQSNDYSLYQPEFSPSPSEIIQAASIYLTLNSVDSQYLQLKLFYGKLS